MPVASTIRLPLDGFVPERIAVFRALQLGDMLCTVPALTALRAAFPAAHITLIGLPWAADFVERYPTLIDALAVFPGAIGFPEQPETNDGLPAFFAAMRPERFDLAIQLHGSGGPANDLLFELGARMHAGFVQRGEQRHGCFIDWPEDGREPDRYLRLLARMGIAASNRDLWFPLTERDRAELQTLVGQHALDPRRTIVVHAGAQWPSRRWPAVRFAAVADALAGAGYSIVLTGTRTEAAIATRVRDAMRRPAIDLTGGTSLGALAALLEQVPLVVCNDTGISHIAAALRTPSVVVASGSDVARWAPADARRHRVLADYPSCRPCMHRDCPIGHVCALNVAVRDVIVAAREQLSAVQRLRVRIAALA